MNVIEENPDEPWDWRALSLNPNLTMEFIEKNHDKPWGWELLFDHDFKKAKEKWIIDNMRLQAIFVLTRIIDQPNIRNIIAQKIDSI